MIPFLVPARVRHLLPSVVIRIERRIGALLSLASAVGISHFAPAIAAELVNDPIPARIAKGPIQIELQPVATGLSSPVLLVAAPGAAGTLLVVDQAGKIRVLQSGKLLDEPFLDLTANLVKLQKDFDERGLLGLAFDPDYGNSQTPGHRRVFIYSSEPASGGTADFPNPHKGAPNHHAVIASWKVAEGEPLRIDSASRVEVMRIDQPQFNHNGGMIAFGPDGLLYIGLGDGGAANDLGPGHNPEIGNGQDPNTVLGKMLRIDVNGKDAANGKYGIPKDNPYVASGGIKEIFAIGLRNPYRFSFDGAALLAGDVGQNKLEYLHRVERGGNYGWRLKEGSFKFNLNGTIEKETSGLPPGLIDPILEYDHDEGTSIIGGFVYHGKLLPQLTGKYVFGDWRGAKSTTSGRLFYADLNSREILELKIGHDDRGLGFLLKGFGLDHDGELYVLGGTHQGPSGTTGVVMKMIGPAIP